MSRIRFPGPVAFVPTMGALHAGHAALIRRARRLAGPNGSAVVSIFVNPTQFGPNEDFSRYPRTEAEDLALCAACGADAVFIPTAAQIYAPDASVQVRETALSSRLCGPGRPGHFDGVCTVVTILFGIVRPDIAVFGQKDYQQLAIIRRMARDLHMPVRIVGVPTVREPDGLALSSRNRYLSPEERSQAPAIRRALLEASRSGERSPSKLAARIRRSLAAAPLARVDYAEVLDADRLTPPDRSTRRVVAAVAVFFGKTRLIDNIVFPF